MTNLALRGGPSVGTLMPCLQAWAEHSTPCPRPPVGAGRDSHPQACMPAWANTRTDIPPSWSRGRPRPVAGAPTASKARAGEAREAQG
eukprot:scaffold125218_cov29-Tisochrysis_lutea.AAC.1